MSKRMRYVYYVAVCFMFTPVYTPANSKYDIKQAELRAKKAKLDYEKKKEISCILKKQEKKWKKYNKKNIIKRNFDQLRETDIKRNNNYELPVQNIPAIIDPSNTILNDNNEEEQLNENVDVEIQNSALTNVLSFFLKLRGFSSFARDGASEFEIILVSAILLVIWPFFINKYVEAYLKNGISRLSWITGLNFSTWETVTTSIVIGCEFLEWLKGSRSIFMTLASTVFSTFAAVSAWRVADIVVSKIRPFVDI